jgi:isoquinoline 1-oxidoreductase beta subunit
LGKVVETATGRSLTYGVLAAGAARLPPPAEPPLKAPEAWRYIGRAMPRLDLPSKVDGSAVYGLDVELPGMLVATLAQSPRFGGRLVSVDEAPAMAVAGVRRVVKLDRAVAVVAEGYWAAQTGLAVLNPTWTPGPLAGVSSADISAKLHALVLAGGETTHLLSRVDAAAAKSANESALANAARRLNATYEVPLLSHSPLEAMNATAQVSSSGAELWVPTQVQSDMRRDVARALGIAEDQVEIHTTQLGGGFGRRLQTDYGVLAALVARGFDVPVKLMWGRAEDTQHGFYRPATVAGLEAALDAAGAPIAFRADIACLDSDPFGGIATTPYAFPNAWVAATTWNPGVPIGAWRSVDWSQNTFFVESFVDELAAAAGEDPLAYRARLLARNPRMLRLLRAAGDRAEWSESAPPGRFRGVALCERGGTLCVEIVELSLLGAGAAPRVHKVTAAIDCGTAVNPGQIRAQVEGGVIMALSAALAQEITLADGRVEQAYFDTFPMVHMAQAPGVETVILETLGARITGVGEPPVPPLAPALCNALAAATGRRVRVLPIVSQKRGKGAPA